jgi:hypothetical protein
MVKHEDKMKTIRIRESSRFLELKKSTIIIMAKAGQKVNGVTRSMKNSEGPIWDIEVDNRGIIPKANAEITVINSRKGFSVMPFSRAKLTLSPPLSCYLLIYSSSLRTDLPLGLVTITTEYNSMVLKTIIG